MANFTERVDHVLKGLEKLMHEEEYRRTFENVAQLQLEQLVFEARAKAVIMGLTDGHNFVKHEFELAV